jgi:hypothetical protein
MRRLSPEGTPVPRIRMTKKERRKLRQEFNNVKDLKADELANKILEIPVVNPLGALPVEEPKKEIIGA